MGTRAASPAHAPRAASATPLAATIPRPAAPPAPSPSGDVRVQVTLELAGPAEQVEALLAAVCEKPIQIYPLTLCVKDRR